MKKILSLFVFIALIAAFATTTFAASNDGISTCANNVITIITSFHISDTGYATVDVKYFGYNGITQGGTVITRIEKLEGNVWRTVDIGQPNNQWVDVSTQVNFIKSHTHQLTSRGTYRAVVNYEVYGTGGAPDVIERIIEKTY